MQGSSAPELSAGEWINAEPLKMRKLRDRVVLVNFWSYSCINCVRMLPYINILHRKYSKKGLTIIGVHSPVFGFEKLRKNVKAAAKRHKIHYPVVLDNEMKTWESYNNRFWPCQYIIGGKGKIRHIHAGEGANAETELWIVKLLAENGIGVKSKIGRSERTAYNINTTLEMHCGKKRCQIGNPSDSIYIDNVKHEVGRIYLDGKWSQEREYLESSDGRITVVFRAKSANIVMEPVGEPASVRVFIDGVPVGPANSGADIASKNMVNVDRADVYRIYSRKEFGTHEMRIETNKPVRFFSFTFG